MKKINLLVADDEKVVREGLCSLLKQEPFVYVTEQTIELVLLDMRMPEMSGREVARILCKKHPLIKVIAFTGLDGHDLVLSLLNIGVHSIVNKLNGYDEIVKAIKQVFETGSYLPENILKIISQYASRWKEVPTKTLDEKDIMIIQALIDGESTKQLAEKLNISRDTAEKRRQRLLNKVGVPNTASLIAFAFRNGII
jgi:DNA-binding NarL/FixJ family response regulator